MQNARDRLWTTCQKISAEHGSELHDRIIEIIEDYVSDLERSVGYLKDDMRDVQTDISSARKDIDSLDR